MRKLKTPLRRQSHAGTSKCEDPKRQATSDKRPYCRRYRVMAIREVEGQAGLPCPQSTKSYWHREPSEKLLGHRSTPGLPPTADIVVVGSGMTGAFAAHFLKAGAAANSELLMLEAR